MQNNEFKDKHHMREEEREGKWHFWAFIIFHNWTRVLGYRVMICAINFEEEIKGQLIDDIFTHYPRKQEPRLEFRSFWLPESLVTVHSRDSEGRGREEKGRQGVQQLFGKQTLFRPNWCSFVHIISYTQEDWDPLINWHEEPNFHDLMTFSLYFHPINCFFLQTPEFLMFCTIFTYGHWRQLIHLNMERFLVNINKLNEGLQF